MFDNITIVAIKDFGYLVNGKEYQTNKEMAEILINKGVAILKDDYISFLESLKLENKKEVDTNIKKRIKTK